MQTARTRELLARLDYGPAPESDKKARAWLKSHGAKFDHFIGNEWRKSSTAECFNTVNPAKFDEVLAEVAEGSPEDVDAAMQAAAGAFPGWSALPGFQRAKYLYAIARAIARHSRLFAVLESLDNGKTIRECRDIDIPLVIRHFYFYAGLALFEEMGIVHMKPGGVIGQIIPWNFPLLMLAWKIAPAIAVGNTVVLKPAEFTPLTAALFAEILRDEVKLPAGVVNIVFGDGRTGEAIVLHPTPWKIAFTGSTEIGRRIRELTAGSGKKLTLELGGKSPFIVFADSDLDAVVEGVVDAIWFNQGQVCCAGSRILVEESIAELLTMKLRRRMATLRGGSPLDKCMDFGAMNSKAQYEKVTRLVDQGKAEGAECWQSPCDLPKDGWFIPPTLFTSVDPSDTIAQVEIFGPVVVMMTFRTPAEAVALANNTPYGLAASVWTENIGKANDVARQLKAGTVWINCTNQFDAASGFGGYRESGFGREGGLEGLEDVLVEDYPESPNEGSVLADADNTIGITPEIDRTHRFLIGGKLVRPDAGGSFYLKRSEVNLAVLSEASGKDVRNAVEEAEKAQSGWANQTAHLRAQILYFLAENLSQHRERFVSVLRAELGCTAAEAGREFDLALQRLFLWSSFADKFGGTVQSVATSAIVVAVNEAIGVIGIRAPDEAPLLGLVNTIGPAIAMGNAVVVVAGVNGLTASNLIKVIQNSDVPAGVVNILTASDPDGIAEMLANHMAVDAVWCFSGNDACAKVERASACNMKRTFVSHGKRVQWAGLQGKSRQWLRRATQVKNTWTPFGA